MASDPTVSAVVQLAAPRDSLTQQDIAKAKGHFTAAGFEVHAPLGTSFSIGGKRSLFEKVFGQSLTVDEQTVGAVVTVEGGSLELPTEALPEDVRAQVKGVSFMPPPPLVFSDQ
ncbi:MAG TPA: hypothetical protein VM264_06160 [Acidimicrobiales bacterium]|jgi:hypothetical protein|nr:hypothetical protein [Acidimicrobiales bacterium]